jgi:hypothetical protein
MGARAYVGIVVALCAMLAGSPVAAGSTSPRAIAEAINLRASDVPAFSPQRSGNNSASSPLDARVKRSCAALEAGQAKHGYAVNTNSPMFVSASGVGEEEVQSAVAIEPSRRVVARDLALVRAPRLRDCLRNALEGLTFSIGGVSESITHVRVARLPVAATGADGGYGLRVVMFISALFVSVPVTLDVSEFAVGRDEISLVTGAVAESFPRQTERQLSSLLVSRALAQPH